MKVYTCLSTQSPYQKEDRVEGVVYEINPELGAFVAVDDRYSALIPKKELYGEIRIGDTVTARVTAVREDGKLDLSVRERLTCKWKRTRSVCWSFWMEKRAFCPLRTRLLPKS